MAKSNTTIAICYHSGKGHTAAIAREIATGAEAEPAATVHVIDVTAQPVPWDQLFDADAIVFGCPTHFGGISAELKAFLDSTDAFWGEMRWRDKIAAGFTCAGEPSGDKQSVLMALSVFAAQHGMVWVGMDPMNDVRTGKGKPESYNIQGGYLGGMADSDGDAVTADSPPEADRVTARLFGRRIAVATRRWATNDREHA